MRYAMLLRGVNMMGKNTLVMTDLMDSLHAIGLKNVAYYINSGNVFFDSRMSIENLYRRIKKHLQSHHGLLVDFVLLTKNDLHDEWQNLPSFWHGDSPKKEVLFFMPNFNKDEFLQSFDNYEPNNEHLYIGKTAIFWCGFNAHDKNTTYNHKLIKPKFLKNLSIRNGKTFNAMFDFL